MNKICLGLTTLSLTSVLAASALADNEVLRSGGGEIQDQACGLLNRSVTLCLAKAKKSQEDYLVLKVFAPRSQTYIPVTFRNTTPPGRTGVSTGEFNGRAAAILSNGSVYERTYKLVTKQVVAPNAKMNVQLIVNGASSGPTIELDRPSSN